MKNSQRTLLTFAFTCSLACPGNQCVANAAEFRSVVAAELRDTRKMIGTDTISPVIVTQLGGQDVGAKINGYIAASGATGELTIPDGIYSFSTPILIRQSESQSLRIHCQSRAAVLTYTGAGDAIEITSAGNPQAQTTIDNCTLINGGSATNGVHLFFDQNAHLTNMLISGFVGSDLLGEGIINGVFIGNDFEGANYPVELEPDTADIFASNSNHFYGGSMNYGKYADFWDAGTSANDGGDTSDTVDGVVMEMSSNHPCFIIEGTWNDAITNSYMEYLTFTTSTSTMYGGIVGNRTGSGFGSNRTYTAANFNFSNNHLRTLAGGSGWITAGLYLINSLNARLVNLNDTGNPTYGIAFDPLGSNSGAVSSGLAIGWQTALYLNPPSSGSLEQSGGQPVAPGQYRYSADGLIQNISQLQSSKLQLGGGTVLNAANVYTFIAGPASLSAGCEDDVIYVPGIAASDNITSITPPSSLGPVTLTAYASDTNYVTMHICSSSRIIVTPPVGTYRVLAIH